ncbi:16S rRNA (uracil(1498)-N(3))-methyltransferase [Achromobacter sp. UMC71]|uniref:16S rRNA (uracil(1498)-N(3))-methyltransferase n=1 Tax=Achromobacter sp. UMC71 TaxID=1862320 RepID=UPI0016047820|nr:16S rRNA (uracil(1498)-N(3))-methyltransferase [Achromobacter sp. UMC71]MBB1626128.1 16S rRNA (uracil(1498)-N(3))-methyltransferase [Achromobacter sp. UMC71]
MSAPRFFCDAPLSARARIALPDALAHHALRVLRLRAGESVILFNGKGGEYPAVLEVEGKAGFAQLGAFEAREAELAGRITLVQGLPSGDKMDWVVEKAVELGAAQVCPIAAQRSVLQLSGPRLDKRVAHWQRIAQSAAEQCGRNRLMTVNAPVTLADWLALPADGLRLLCHPDADTDLAGLLHATPSLASLTLLVGPEGGWSDKELAEARKAGVQAVRFGPRVLRTETAGLALIAAAGALLGW